MQILNSICRGLVGYVSYLASCSSSQVYSEYLLYEPVLRIAQSKNYRVNCEWPMRALTRKPNGDHRRIDFEMRREGERFALEVKWIRSKSVNCSVDFEKLMQFIAENPDSRGYLLIFGHLKFVGDFKLKGSPRVLSRGKCVQWNAGKTEYAAQWLRVA